MIEHVSVTLDVPVLMRDGIILRANVFRPVADGSYPVLLSRTPYSKDRSALNAIFDSIRLARAGYIVIVQDVRGRGSSGGEWCPFKHEGDDGFDSILWAANLPDSNGNVGMFGLSYLGFTQWITAVQAPWPLKALLPLQTWAGSTDGLIWRGGAFELGLMARWLLQRGLDTMDRRIREFHTTDLSSSIRTLVQVLDELPDQTYQRFVEEGLPFLRTLGIWDEFSEALSVGKSPDFASPFPDRSAYEQVRVPAYNIAGWYDSFLQGTLTNFARLRDGAQTWAARQQKLLIGPWAHVVLGSVVGDRDFGLASSINSIDLQMDLTDLAQRWFDYWLKGIDNGVVEEPPIKLFVMGANIWRHETTWPLERTEYRPLYLQASNRASFGEPGIGSEDHYVYDPAAPTPTFGGPLVMNPTYGIGVEDQRRIEARKDVLIYTSEPLTQDIEVTGPIVAKLWAATDAPDTDFVVRLIDVYPDGFSQNLTDGIIRARFRSGRDEGVLEAGLIYDYSIDLWSTANVFKRGHCIRVHVASASFPRWDPNPNTGKPFGTDGELRPAHQTIYCGGRFPSHIVLPVIPE